MLQPRSPGRSVPLLGCALLLLLATCDGGGPLSPSPQPARPHLDLASAPNVLLVAGDVASCSSTGDEATATLLDGLAGTVVTLGDNAYSSGTATEYANCYGPTWGRHLARTRPVAGERDYSTSGAAGYFDYFNGIGAATGPAGDRLTGYYSFDAATWHVIVLNSKLSASAGSAQEKWLKADLAATTQACVVALWHLPRFSSSTSSVQSSVKALWDDLYAAGAELVLNAHYKNYERLAPQNPDGMADAGYGIREFIVGTGGAGKSSFSTIRATSEARSTGINGVLELTLNDGSYGWRFVPASGSYTDRGTGNCHAPPPPVAKPGGPYAAERTIVFDGGTSTDPSLNPPLTYAWDFGDGTTGTGKNPSHIYSAFGVYTVTLIVTNAKGVSSIPATATATLSNVAPTVSAGSDRWVLPGQSLSLSATFTDPGTDSPFDYAIDWGDGATSIGRILGAPAPISGIHSYPTAGQYTIRVQVTDANGGASSDDILLDVRAPSPGASILVGAGDIARCDATNDEATGRLLDAIGGTVFTTGDNAYSSGTAAQYVCYGASWGRHAARTRPAPGEREYSTSGAAGYFDYFNGIGNATGPAGDRTTGYYSYDMANWHVVVLNTQLATSVGSPQEQWLKADLAAFPRACTIAIWHQPRFYSSGSKSALKPLWDLLYTAGAEVIVNGHQHNYERFAPQNSDAKADPAFGIRQFVVGSGGIGHTSFGTAAANSEVRDATSYGVLKLTLDAESYFWEFIPVAGASFTDKGFGRCHESPVPKANPGGPYRSERIVVFDGSGSTNPLGGTLTYAWTFGDGGTATTVQPSHSYAADGVYTATLIVTDSRGVKSAVASAIVTVGNGAPAVNAGADARVDMPAEFVLSGTFSDFGTADAPWRYSIDWGDGATTDGSTNDQSAPLTTRHGYQSEGRYTVRLTVTDKDGGTGSDDVLVTVDDHIMAFSLAPVTVPLDAGETTQLVATAVGMTGRDLARSYAWSTSDGTIAGVSSSGLVSAVSAGVATITAEIEGRSASVGLVVQGLPFGPFHLPDESFVGPYTGVLRGVHPYDVIATLEAARQAHYGVVLRLAAGSSNYSNPDSSFSLDLWKQNMDRYRGVDFSSYIADGTIVGHFLFDEPRDPTNWGGIAVPFAELEAAAAYSESLWPGMLTGVGSSAVDLEAGGPYQTLDFAFAQYRTKKGEINQWRSDQVNAAKRGGLGLVLSINVLEGNLDKSPYTADQVRTIGMVLAAEPYACALTMWKWDELDPSYFANPANIAAMADIAKVANARPRHLCRRD